MRRHLNGYGWVWRCSSDMVNSQLETDLVVPEMHLFFCIRMLWLLEVIFFFFGFL